MPEMPAAPDAKPAVEKAAAPSKEEPVSQDKTAALERRLDEVEKAVAAFQEKAATKQDIEDLKLALTKSPQKKEAANDSPKESASQEEGVKEKKVNPAALHRQKKAPAVTAASKKWVLRSAKPGTAWISEAGSNELRTVSVGETLPGVGKVMSVTKNAEGRWVVNGTTGKVYQ
jgi:intracellular multiplication protein IcmG